MTKIDLLIIDDFGLKPLKSPADEDFHDLIAERYERVTTLVTSNWILPSGRRLPQQTARGGHTRPAQARGLSADSGWEKLPQPQGCGRIRPARQPGPANPK